MNFKKIILLFYFLTLFSCAENINKDYHRVIKYNDKSIAKLVFMECLKDKIYICNFKETKTIIDLLKSGSINPPKDYKISPLAKNDEIDVYKFLPECAFTIYYDDQRFTTYYLLTIQSTKLLYLQNAEGKILFLDKKDIVTLQKLIKEFQFSSKTN